MQNTYEMHSDKGGVVGKRRGGYKQHSENIGAVSGFAKVDPQTAAAKVGRNDPCPCGSGKKLKRCCKSNRPEMTDGITAAASSGATLRVKDEG